MVLKNKITFRFLCRVLLWTLFVRSKTKLT